MHCGIEICNYNQDGICTASEITLSENHYCDGGCDDGWDIPCDELEEE